MLTQSNTLSDFYKLTPSERSVRISDYANLEPEDREALTTGLSLEQADSMIENVVGRYILPFGIGTHFSINGREVAVPMVVEEPSIVAGVSYAAKLIAAGGGFKTSSSEPIMIGQVQLLDVQDIEQATAAILEAEPELLAAANRYHPTIQKLGGGAKRIECHSLPDTPAGPMLIVHLLYDCRDAMGANAVNTAVEAITPMIEQLTGGRVNLRILSNLTDQRTARAEGLVPVEQLSRSGFSGEQVAQAIFEAWAFAAADPYRAATHNKGIMNGIDAVALATGNDWRALEAGAHAYAARHGRYTSLTEWSLITQDDGKFLKGVLDMPLSVGTVGGATKAHPTARVSMKILKNPNARTLAEIMVATGLAQNLAALRALATEGIQHGHMRLHARQVALAAGATGDQIQKIANILVSEQNIREERARALIHQSEQKVTNT
ncbi:MAG: hydroxymethylglutaryl-CoA reductase, degradative [Anaerolineae bacterium]|nr:hydroxymethylglutaryl-CoA reductase, degradative [Anaerolineae bacterium]